MHILDTVGHPLGYRDTLIDLGSDHPCEGGPERGGGLDRVQWFMVWEQVGNKSYCYLTLSLTSNLVGK